MIWDYLKKYGEIQSTKGQKANNISALSFKYLGIYFTADWCGVCVRSSQALKKVINRIDQFDPTAFKMLTIRLDETDSSFGYHYWKFSKFDYFKSNQLAQTLNVRVLPTIMIFNSSGRLVSTNGFRQIFAHKEKVISYWNGLTE